LPLNDALSIVAAAQDAGEATALRIGEQRCTFGQLADMARARLRELDLDAGGDAPFPLTGTNTLQTLVTLYALLQARVPALLLHPRQTDSERSAVLDAAQQAGRVSNRTRLR
jgi:O-succinylbenzoic acid--CoA ligase